MVDRVAPSYIGCFYHVRSDGPLTYSLTKRQGDRVFATYYVHVKTWHGNTWLECDSGHCQFALHRSATGCKHVKIAQAHIDTDEEESAVRWIKGGL